MRTHPLAANSALCRCRLAQVRCQAGRDRAEPLANPRHSQSPTAAHAYASSLPLGRHAVDTPDTPTPKKQMPAKQPQQALHHETAYTFVAPNWEPLVGRSRQHQRVEKDVSCSTASAAVCTVPCHAVPGPRRATQTISHLCALGLQHMLLRPATCKQPTSGLSGSFSAVHPAVPSNTNLVCWVALTSAHSWCCTLPPAGAQGLWVTCPAGDLWRCRAQHAEGGSYGACART